MGSGTTPRPFNFPTWRLFKEKHILHNTKQKRSHVNFILIFIPVRWCVKQGIWWNLFGDLFHQIHRFTSNLVVYHPQNLQEITILKPRENEFFGLLKKWNSKWVYNKRLVLSSKNLIFFSGTALCIIRAQPCFGFLLARIFQPLVLPVPLIFMMIPCLLKFIIDRDTIFLFLC